ncbi:MAG: ankyrin repeat domain-containing protein [Sphaerochaetaceae bacterium]|jgi:ankyrin repeat protein|nr:ankyrin repeat domain-containing protein [Sphaerochaetaceae bacterium]MDD3670529.1 ankyrin repeat domain-containing protein [Sphaerochaetaceae bacterium]MDD4260072.1 ankyrin repeat domain-containing protein [Sphaerochaetaceae bacterium]MDD5077156.1 ankyrin repeat domain-containing protein [Sphaerochaetaceae bacterium]NLO60336.1 hypothetical protein [Spirochaetales bacterium]
MINQSLVEQAIQAVSEHDDLEYLQRLFDMLGAFGNLKDKGESMLWHAVRFNESVEVVKLLLGRGATPNDNILKTAIIHNPNPNITMQLCDAFGKLEQEQLDAAFLYAAASCHDDILIRYFHKLGANLSATLPMDIYMDQEDFSTDWEDEDEYEFDEHPVEQNAIVVAIYENPQPDLMVEHLSSLGVPVDTPDSEGYVPLLHALDNARVVQVLLEHHADPNCTDVHGNSALMLSCEAENGNTVFTLLKAGAEVHTVSSRGETALHQALMCHMRDNTEVVKALIEAGSDVNLPDKDGNMPLRLALSNCAPESVIRLLTNAGAQLELSDIS